MRIRSTALLATVLVALSGAVRADDIVYFTNGTTMPVRSHKIEKGMIRVDLGNNAVMAFPVSKVEKVETAGRAVFPNGGGTGPANQTVAGPNTTVTGYATVPAQYRQVRRDDPAEQLAQAQARAQAQKDGGDLYHSAGNTGAKRNLRVIAGGAPVVSQDGTYKRGNLTVLPAPNAPIAPGGGDDSKPTVTSFGPAVNKAEPVAEEDSGSSSGDGDGDGDESGTPDPDADDPPDQQ